MLVSTTTTTMTRLETTLTTMAYCHSHTMIPVVPAVGAEEQQGYDRHPPSRKHGR
jgi:hypothetical protein